MAILGGDGSGFELVLAAIRRRRQEDQQIREGQEGAGNTRDAAATGRTPETVQAVDRSRALGQAAAPNSLLQLAAAGKRAETGESLLIPAADREASWLDSRPPLPSITLRRPDAFGSGSFGAPRDRGTRTHLGLDLAAEPGTPVYAPIAGQVYVGPSYPVGDAAKAYLRTVAVVDKATGRHAELSYVDPLPTLKKGDQVAAGAQIGISQSLQPAYPPKAAGPITNHVHVALKKGAALTPVDPTEWVEYWRSGGAKR